MTPHVPLTQKLPSVHTELFVTHDNPVGDDVGGSVVNGTGALIAKRHPNARKIRNSILLFSPSIKTTQKSSYFFLWS